MCCICESTGGCVACCRCSGGPPLECNQVCEGM
jgi:hypothetical protein